MSNKFKDGDLVYSPTDEVKVFQVVNRGDGFTYELKVGNQTFTSCGKALSGQNYPSIFHATKENQALLEALYDMKFDDPPLSNKEKVILALQGANGKPVVCWVKSGNSNWYVRAVGSFENNQFLSLDRTLEYSDAKPLSSDEFILA